MSGQEIDRAILKQAGTVYPRVTNLRRSLRGEINEAIKAAAQKAIPDFDPGTSIVEAAGSYLTTVNTNGVLSLKFQDYILPELAAHGVSGQSSITLSLETGRIFAFADLFRPGADYRAAIDRIILAQIAAQGIPMLKPFAGVGPDTDYYLTAESLVIYYQPYVYTPGAYGVLEFVIPYGEIGAIVDPRGPIGRIIAGR